MSTDEKTQLLNDKEVQFLVLSSAIGHGDSGVTREDATKVVDWAENAKMDAALLRLVMEGRIVVRVQDDGELEFKSVDEPFSYEDFLSGKRPS